MGCRLFEGRFGYRCLFSSVPPVSAARHPWDGVAESLAEVQCGFVDGQVVDGGPEFQEVSVALAFVAVVSTAGQVHGERPAAGRG